jgi:adenosine kinase
VFISGSIFVIVLKAYILQMIIVTGTVAYDYIMDFPGGFSDHIIPEEIHKINLSFIVNKFAKRRGGTAGNISYSLALLTVPHILFTVAGKDFTEYQKDFQKLGINLSNVKIDKNEYTSTGFAMTDKNDNQIWGYFYGASDGIKDLKLNTVVKKDDLVLIGPSGAKGSMSLVNQCVALNTSYMFDPGFILTQVVDQDLALGARNAKIIIGNDYEITLIKERVKDWEKFFPRKMIITTLGKDGATINDKGKVYKIKPAAIKAVVDPTGAGDAWRSGFLAGLEKGFDLQTCGQMGAVTSAYAIEHYGTQEHTFTKKEFTERYRQNYKALLKL